MTKERKKEIKQAVLEAKKLGENAFKRGASMGSAFDPEMYDLLERLKLKVEEGLPVINAWNDGFIDAQLAEARKIFVF